MARNPGTRIGRPPKMAMPSKMKMPSGERQGQSPMDGYDSAIPGGAFPRGMAMPQHHDDPSMLRKGGFVKGRRR